MDKKIDFVYRDVVRKLGPLLKEIDLENLSKHNRGYLEYEEDPVERFIYLEMNRFKKTIGYINDNIEKGTKVLDIGLFIPFIPLALNELGYDVHCAEKFALYDGSLQPVIDLCEEQGIHLWDYDDLFKEKRAIPEFDLVLLTAVLEHLNGSPKELLETARSLLKDGGLLNVEAPNVCSLRKRFGFLFKGNPPFPPYHAYFQSKYPFSGHNREYTTGDLEYCLVNSGFKLIRLETYMYSDPKRLPLRSKILYYIEKYRSHDWKEGIWALASKQ